MCSMMSCGVRAPSAESSLNEDAARSNEQRVRSLQVSPRQLLLPPCVTWPETLVCWWSDSRPEALWMKAVSTLIKTQNRADEQTGLGRRKWATWHHDTESLSQRDGLKVWMWACCWTRDQGRARTQSPTTRNYAVEIPTFGEFAEVSSTGVQWLSLALGEPPSWSWYLPCQVSMTWTQHRQGPGSGRNRLLWRLSIQINTQHEHEWTWLKPK